MPDDRMDQDAHHKSSCKTLVLYSICSAVQPGAILNVLHVFVGKKWQGITFTTLQFKAVMVSDYWIKPESPPP